MLPLMYAIITIYYILNQRRKIINVLPTLNFGLIVLSEQLRFTKVIFDALNAMLSPKTDIFVFLYFQQFTDQCIIPYSSKLWKASQMFPNKTCSQTICESLPLKLCHVKWNCEIISQIQELSNSNLKIVELYVLM